MSAIGSSTLHHAGWSRREILQAGTLGLMGLSMSDVERLRAESAAPRRPRAVIFVFLTGGLAQHESFDPKPNATENVRGEFAPISTRTPGLQICEHLPLLAARSDKWALCRSVSHGWNEHVQGTCLMLTGRSGLPPSFSSSPKPSEFPGIAAMAGRMVPGLNGLPGSTVLPYPIKTPGTLAGRMGPRFDPWLLKAASDCKWSGACPNCWDHQRRPEARHTGYPVFRAPNLSLADGLTQGRIDNRKALLGSIERQQRFLDQYATVNSLERYRSGALSLLTSGRVRRAFDIENADPKALDRYGRNLFGYSLLMAARLVEVGVSMVQVNLGRGGFDTHGNAFDHLKNLMLPPTDQAMSALLGTIERQQGFLDQYATVNSLDRYRSGALSLLTSGRVRRAFDIENADPKALDRYGRNLFGYSLLMAARLVEVGVSMVQVNLGRGGFDTHGNAFDHLKNLMLPPLSHSFFYLLQKKSFSRATFLHGPKNFRCTS